MNDLFNRPVVRCVVECWACTTEIIMIMIMTSGWGLQQRPTSPITKKMQYTKNKN